MIISKAIGSLYTKLTSNEAPLSKPTEKMKHLADIILRNCPNAPTVGLILTRLHKDISAHIGRGSYTNAQGQPYSIDMPTENMDVEKKFQWLVNVCFAPLFYVKNRKEKVDFLRKAFIGIGLKSHYNLQDLLELINSSKLSKRIKFYLLSLILQSILTTHQCDWCSLDDEHCISRYVSIMLYGGKPYDLLKFFDSRKFGLTYQNILSEMDSELLFKNHIKFQERHNNLSVLSETSCKYALGPFKITSTSIRSDKAYLMELIWKQIFKNRESIVIESKDAGYYNQINEVEITAISKAMKGSQLKRIEFTGYSLTPRDLEKLQNESIEVIVNGVSLPKSPNIWLGQS
ncbi:MAG: hypothetical protein JSR58_05930 [Verrucomicrobia bacterium]|nr:hypothetical protein [Verrucomicrobiota bacterium]